MLKLQRFTRLSHRVILWVGAIIIIITITHASILTFTRQSGWSLPAMGSKVNLNLLITDVCALEKLLHKKHVTSEALVDSYVSHINKHDHYLHAVIQLTPPNLLKERATLLDQERAQGKIRGPLHGIPIIIKVGLVEQLSSVSRYLLLTTLGQ
jgi:hypothetical protein